MDFNELLQNQLNEQGKMHEQRMKDNQDKYEKEDVYDEEEYQRDVTFRWYGRVEGTMYINLDYGSINYEHSGVSLDYVQVIDKL